MGKFFFLKYCLIPFTTGYYLKKILDKTFDTGFDRLNKTLDTGFDRLDKTLDTGIGLYQNKMFFFVNP